MHLPKFQSRRIHSDTTYSLGSPSLFIDERLMQNAVIFTAFSNKHPIISLLAFVYPLVPQLSA